MQLQQLICFPVLRKLTVLGCVQIRSSAVVETLCFSFIVSETPVWSRSQRQQSIKTSVATKVDTSFTFMSLQSASSCILSPTHRTPTWTRRTTQLNSTHWDRIWTRAQGTTQLHTKCLVGTSWRDSYQTLTVSFWTTQTHRHRLRLRLRCGTECIIAPGLNLVEQISRSFSQFLTWCICLQLSHSDG